MDDDSIVDDVEANLASDDVVVADGLDGVDVFDVDKDDIDLRYHYIEYVDANNDDAYGNDLDFFYIHYAVQDDDDEDVEDDIDDDDDVHDNDNVNDEDDDDYDIDIDNDNAIDKDDDDDDDDEGGNGNGDC